MARCRHPCSDPRKAKPGEAAGVGDRALLRVEKLSEPEAPLPVRRVIKVLDRAKKRMIGIFRSLPGGGGRLIPVDKKALGRERAIVPTRLLDAEDGELVAADVAKEGRFGLPDRAHQGTPGIAEGRKGRQPDRIHAHGIPHVFSREALAEADAAKPADLSGGREDWRNVPLVTIDPADAKDHDDAVYAEPDTNPDNRGGYIVRSRSPMSRIMLRPGSALDREALTAAIDLFRTAWCRCCRNVFRTTCVR